jgi:hypothetical protein
MLRTTFPTMASDFSGTFFVVDGDHDFSAVPAPLSADRQRFPWT